MPEPSERERAVATGTILSYHAARAPDRPALGGPLGERTFAELDAAANRWVRAFEARGLGRGDAVAMVCANRPEFVEVVAACQRGGFRLTPINWHLTGEEIGYIVENCEAKALVGDARFADAIAAGAGRARGVAVGGEIPGFESAAAALAAESGEALAAPVLGGTMLYTSGTTGRPKGVHRKSVPPSLLLPPLQRTAAFEGETDFALCTGPLYHAAPLALNLQLPLASGVGVYLMDHWDAEETLRVIAEHRVTHTHMVATMFHRLLALPEETRKAHDVSSLRWVLHGAAPCPVHVKRSMIDWFGPVVHEYYAATEGGAFFITAEEWLEKPGSVGHVGEQDVLLLTESGDEAAAEEVGTVYFRAPEKGRFQYYKAPEKTQSAYHTTSDGRDYFTMGDLGRFDAEGWLFLTGRSAELILSAGVNVYPAEIDAALLMHPAVGDVATVGVPNEEWGEEVKSVIQLAEGQTPSEALSAELLAHCREHLAGYKCPRSIDYSDDLPRLPTGKIQRGRVRERYL
ncbi:MAG: AMP-binding protein [Myxococcales bacterium]|nr:AMP-binding protein [Myxococcales bacterium]